MLYKFKSRSTADVIMLEPNARQILTIIGKDPNEHHGIVTVAQIPGAIAALEKAVVAEENLGRADKDKISESDNAAEDDQNVSEGELVELRQRAIPFIDMLRRSAAENNDVIW
ncbi:DUF1840 domain-containing protein [Diaphorobacter aerolatus]|uniref:DUF1840 domain-containing protein n=1 Tax=Diaphorobacter aerolatus TaxID=1288495 RepID=A0A7H0GP60_9BURK|nr:DUF1840 domain-containing protein [Diaphorobacter aerolatus]QNP50076.1 DUF1840 domain-containing protein [Diaphorobacter aerolatus]